MPDPTHLSWPFFTVWHRDLADELQLWCADNLVGRFADDLDSECRMLVRQLGAAGFLKLCVADADRRPDVRSLALARETLAYHSALADQLAKGPSLAHSITKRQLDAEASMTLEEALEAEARVQARCMETNDFKRAYEAFANKRQPEFRGD